MTLPAMMGIALIASTFVVGAICIDDIVPPAGEVSFAGGASISHVKVAANTRTSTRGLMGISALSSDMGMLFDMSIQSDKHIFWMKNTLIPLDIIYVDDQWRVVGIDTMMPCRVHPCRLYRSESPYKYAIETVSGWSHSKNLKIGERMKFTPFTLMQRLQLQIM